MRKLANSAARDIASPAVKMGNKGLFPGVAVPLAFFCTLFFRHRKKSVNAPWDGKSLSRAAVGASGPGKGVLTAILGTSSQAGGFPPPHPFGRRTEFPYAFFPCPFVNSPYRTIIKTAKIIRYTG